MREKDSKSGFMMNAALCGAMLLTSLAAVYLFTQRGGAVVNYCAVPISLVAMYLTYHKGAKVGAIAAGAPTAALFLLCLLFWRGQLLSFLFWIVWLPATLFCMSRLRVGVNGILAERDFYRAECARVAMIDNVTQMRNLHAYLNDAPIYMRISKRYNLSMVVLAVKLVNVKPLRETLTDVAYCELLEGISHAMRACVRLEDLAYFVSDENGTWCINMFTHLDSIDIIIDRLKKALAPLKPDLEQDDPACTLRFSYGYALYDVENERSPINLLQLAIDMTEKDGEA